MKTRFIFFLSLLFAFCSCEESEPDSSREPDLDTYHYRIPVIFHVLYNNRNNENQYVKAHRIQEIIKGCNRLYNNSNGKSVDMNLEFVLATEDPQGNALAEPGIKRVYWNDPVMDYKNFMYSNKRSDIDLLWDTDRYINIVLYTFTSNNTLGVSHLPYTVAPDSYPGLKQLKGLPTHQSLSYPHCISINNSYIYEGPSIEGRSYTSVDVIATVAHELGHYLGLHHAFSEDEEGNIDFCEDTDYCEDTPPYNRKEYTDWVDSYVPIDGEKLGWDDLPILMRRKDCIHHTVFTPNNVMDYEFSYVNRFTNDQRSRIRYVLSHSPLIPGKKVGRTRTQTRMSAEENFPIRILPFKKKGTVNSALKGKTTI